MTAPKVTPDTIPTPGHWTDYNLRPIKDPPYVRYAVNNAGGKGFHHITPFSTFPTNPDNAQTSTALKWAALYGANDNSHGGVNSSQGYQQLIKDWGISPSQTSFSAIQKAQIGKLYSTYVNQWVKGSENVDTIPDPGEAKAGIGPLPNPLAILQALWAALSSPEFWMRLAEGALGLLLLAVGLAEATGVAEATPLRRVVKALK